MTKVHSQDWRMGSYHHPWSDSVLNTLDLKECIAQTMMIPAWSNKGSSHIRQVEELIVRHKVGGIIFFQGNPLSQAYLTNYYQQNSRVPLLIGIDGEWGLAMRLTNMKRFPYQMTMGAMDNDYLLHNVGYRIGEQCKRLGVHINFAPVVDVNTNENNPIIGFRSFGDNKNKVAQKAAILMQGMQAAGILACAKHFPGHGDTKFDSHLGLPKLSHSKERFNNVELVPFKKIIDNGVKSIMVAHLSIPSLESNSLVPSSLSPKVVNNLLKQELGFKGLVITDALNMGGVKKNYKPGYAELAAIKAGNDILCFPENVPKAIALIYSAILRNELDSNEIRERAESMGLRICFDVSHSHLCCENFNEDFYKFAEIVAPITAHLHIGDAKGVNGEGLQIGDGQINFKKLGKILNKGCPDAYFIHEIWQGNKDSGLGFWTALEKIEGII